MVSYGALTHTHTHASHATRRGYVLVKGARDHVAPPPGARGNFWCLGGVEMGRGKIGTGVKILKVGVRGEDGALHWGP